MSRPQENREIDITRARPKKGAAPAPQGAQPAPHGAGEHAGQQDAQKQHGTARASSARPGGAKAHAGAGGQAGTRPAGARGKRTGRRRAGIAALAVLLALAALAGGAYLYVDSLIDRSDLGSFDDVSSPVSTSAEPSIVPPDFAGVRNLLVLGLDYEAEGPVARDEKHPNTDMILYVRLDGNAHSMTMLQIPRDVFVGEAGGAAGKINGILAKNVDIGDGNGLGAVKTYIETNFGLPIDDYVTIDMDALTEMVDAFGGVEVYVPQNMRYYNEKTGALEGELLQGWRTLLGGDCEFFLRYRQDISTLELMSIAIEVSGMDSADISIGRLPVYGSGQLYAGEHSVVVTAKEETAALLNEYFRPADDPIAAADIGTPEWPTTGGAAGAEMSTMGDVEAVGADEPRK